MLLQAACLLALLTVAAASPEVSEEEPFPFVKQPCALANDTEQHFRRDLLAGQKGAGFWSTKRNWFYDSQGRLVHFSGVTWSGFETPDAVVHGLWGRSMASHLSQMRSLGFNMLRLSFAGETLLPSTKPKNINYLLNPDLKGLNSLQVMDKLIAKCGQNGIKVILDYHRIHLTIANEAGLWYDDTVPAGRWYWNWITLAKRYKGNPTIIGVDLFNEVHPCPTCPNGSPYWNYWAGPKYNFRTASKATANAILRVEPHWIIFLEGFWNYWWGGDVAQVQKHPISLIVPNKLAYSAHEYGPYVYNQSFFNVPNFPKNMPAIFRQHWGYVQEQGIAPVWIGEFGSFYPQTATHTDWVERNEFTTLIAYMRAVRCSWTIAFWGPDSKDTGGILTDDWKTPNSLKLKLLSGIMHRNFGPSPGQKW